MFRADLLKAVKYGADAEGRVVDVSFVESQRDQSGALVFRFSQETNWMEDEVVDLQYTVGAVDGEDG